MAVEFDFFRKIWNPRERDALMEILQQEEDEARSGSHLEVVSRSIGELYDFIAVITNRRGGFMVAVCVMLLIYIGDENTSSYFAINCCLVLIWIIMLLSNYVLRKWKYVVFFVALILVTYFWLYNNQSANALSEFRIVAFANAHVQYLVVLTVLVPIVYHLLVNWLYHGVYQGYLKSAMKKAIVEYINACRDLENNPEGNEDIDMSKVEDKLQRNIIKLCRPSMFTLVWSLIWHWLKSGLIMITEFIEYLTNDDPKNQSVRAYLNENK